MSRYIILSNFQANMVEGQYPITPNLIAELNPVRLISGEWVLPTDVLNDAAFASQMKYLSNCLQREIDFFEFPSPKE
jgi:hypothetical protein